MPNRVKKDPWLIQPGRYEAVLTGPGGRRLLVVDIDVPEPPSRVNHQPPSHLSCHVTAAYTGQPAHVVQQTFITDPIFGLPVLLRDALAMVRLVESGHLAVRAPTSSARQTVARAPHGLFHVQESPS